MADAADTRSLLLTIQANTELLRSNLSAAERSVKEFTDATAANLAKSDAKFAAFGKGLEALKAPLGKLALAGEAGFAFLIGESIVGKTRELLEFAGSIGITAEKIGVSTDFLQEFRYAASQTGASIEVSDTALQKFTRSVGEAANGNKKVIELFDRLGVKVLDAGGKVRTVEDIFKETAGGIAALPDPAQRAADTLTLMGRSAGALIPVMSGGAEGFSRLAAAADQLGVVISPELIANSEQVNHQIAALKLVLDANMASAVASNAAAIARLGDEIIGLIPKINQGLGALRNFIHEAEYYEAKGEEAVGNWYARSPLGLFGVGKDKAAAAKVDATKAHAQITLDGVRDKIDSYSPAKRKAVLARLSPSDRAALGYGSAADTDSLGSTDPGDTNPATGHARHARPRAAPKDHTADNLAEYQIEESALQAKREKLEADLLNTAQGQLAAELAQLEYSKIEADTRVKKQLADKKITQAQAKHLLSLNAENLDDEEELARRKAHARAIEEQAAHDQLALQGQADLLQLDDRMAKTRTERLAIELKLLALQEQLAKRAQQEIIDNPLSTPAAVADARARIGQIDAQHSRNVASIQEQNADPLHQFRTQLIGDVGDINDAFQNMEVDGLKSLQDGIAGVIDGTESMGEAFKKVTASIIADLVRIGIEKALLAGLDAAFGTNTGGSVPTGDFLGTSATSNRLLGFASGGEPPVGVPSLVGERGPELFIPKVAGTIIPNGALRAPNIPSLSASERPVQIQLHVGPGSTFDADVRAVSGPHTVEIVRAAAQPIMDGAQAQTLRTATRPSLPGGFG